MVNFSRLNKELRGGLSVEEYALRAKRLAKKTPSKKLTKKYRDLGTRRTPKTEREDDYSFRIGSLANFDTVNSQVDLTESKNYKINYDKCSNGIAKICTYTQIILHGVWI